MPFALLIRGARDNIEGENMSNFHGCDSDNAAAWGAIVPMVHCQMS